MVEIAGGVVALRALRFAIDAVCDVHKIVTFSCQAASPFDNYIGILQFAEAVILQLNADRRMNPHYPHWERLQQFIDDISKLVQELTDEINQLRSNTSSSIARIVLDPRVKTRLDGLCESIEKKVNNIQQLTSITISANVYKVEPVAILENDSARDFWVRYLGASRTEVPWTTFQQSICTEFSSSSGISISRWRLFAELLVPTSSVGNLSDATVSIQQFQNLLNIFPSFDQTWLTRVMDVLTLPFYWGCISAVDTTENLQNNQPGSFLLRWDTDRKATFRISRHDGGAGIQHRMIFYLLTSEDGKPCGYYTRKEGLTYPSIQTLIETDPKCIHGVENPLQKQAIREAAEFGRSHGGDAYGERFVPAVDDTPVPKSSASPAAESKSTAPPTAIDPMSVTLQAALDVETKSLFGSKSWTSRWAILSGRNISLYRKEGGSSSVVSEFMLGMYTSVIPSATEDGEALLEFEQNDKVVLRLRFQSVDTRVQWLGVLRAKLAFIQATEFVRAEKPTHQVYNLSHIGNDSDSHKGIAVSMRNH